MAWDPKTYLKFGEERTRPAAELLSRVFAEAPERVADLGCGPGNSTALLAARWPDCSLDGVDSSAEMLREAEKSGVTARWMESDIARWNPPARYDVIFSNATLQWLPDHETLMPKLMSHVEPGGWLAFQVPRNFDDASHTLARALTKEVPWAGKFSGFQARAGALSPERYYDILAPLVSKLDIWETRYLQVLDGPDAVFNWMSGTGLRPYLAHLESADRDAFAAEYGARVAKAYPQRSDGKTLFPFQRLFAAAKR